MILTQEMKKIFVSLFAFMAVLGAFAQEKKEFKVMTYNIIHGAMAPWEELSKFISQFHPDVVMLQEIDINTHRKNEEHLHDRNLIAELGYHTKMFSAFGKSISFSGGYYGLGLLSKYPIVKMERVLLPMLSPNHEQRSLLMAIVELDNGDQICVGSTHLDLHADARMAQVQHINKVMLANNLPSIVAGDFNATPDEKEIKYGMSEWMPAMANDAYTYPSEKPETKIDYVFAYPRQAWQVKSAIVPPVQMSDHAPIVVEYELLTTK
jgi:endonuclease/exonuclease/phosphatase family metal-dependent hydrolase